MDKNVIYRLEEESSGRFTVTAEIPTDGQQFLLTPHRYGGHSIAPYTPPNPATVNDKYELIPHGDKYRVKALRSFGSVSAGAVGGVVSGDRILSQRGDCWISHCSTVTGGVEIRDNVKVTDGSYIHADRYSARCLITGSSVISRSNITGRGLIHNATVTASTLNGSVCVEQGGGVHSSTIVGDVSVQFGSSVYTSKVTNSGDRRLYIAGKVEDAEINDQHQVVAVWTRWGWLTAFRAAQVSEEFGRLQVKIGCQDTPSQELLQNLACEEGDEVEAAMVPGMWQMVEAMVSWWPQQDQPLSMREAPGAGEEIPDIVLVREDDDDDDDDV